MFGISRNADLKAYLKASTVQLSLLYLGMWLGEEIGLMRPNLFKILLWESALHDWKTWGLELVLNSNSCSEHHIFSFSFPSGHE